MNKETKRVKNGIWCNWKILKTLRNVELSFAHDMISFYSVVANETSLSFILSIIKIRDLVAVIWCLIYLYCYRFHISIVAIPQCFFVSSLSKIFHCLIAKKESFIHWPVEKESVSYRLGNRNNSVAIIGTKNILRSLSWFFPCREREGWVSFKRSLTCSNDKSIFIRR